MQDLVIYRNMSLFILSQKTSSLIQLKLYIVMYACHTQSVRQTNSLFVKFWCGKMDPDPNQGYFFKIYWIFKQSKIFKLFFLFFFTMQVELCNRTACLTLPQPTKKLLHYYSGTHLVPERKAFRTILSFLNLRNNLIPFIPWNILWSKSLFDGPKFVLQNSLNWS